ncbi:hypothetical protein BKM04_08010 [Pseudomonas syringae pv. syringae]|nr:hypothetical protein AL062_11645 [Pseudomonas syringae pv. syringae]KWS26059.1 hypothetical protein AL061_16265 [Pseudomonas syringae pv. syringae]POD25534.1 hypothetical protein BKM04_08010 [Pseudomonas syringae pv. syringae]POD65466.1 hypothetical protein BKM06_06665 [Pseudomonas syringae pv. syringae]POR64338.1 hypothetical protein BKM10_14205 [Pseudomonas syringae pv. syringae]
MSLVPTQRRIEDADQYQVLLLASAQKVPIVLVKHIHIPRPDRKYVALHVLDFAFTSNAIARLKVIAVMQERLCARADNGVAQRKAHSITFSEQTVTGSGAPFDEIRGVLDIGFVANKHVKPL